MGEPIENLESIAVHIERNRTGNGWLVWATYYLAGSQNGSKTLDNLVPTYDEAIECAEELLKREQVTNG